MTVSAAKSKPAALKSTDLRLAAGVRELSRAVAHIHDLRTFFALFEAGLAKTGVCAALQLEPVGAEGVTQSDRLFTDSQLTVPIAAEPGIVAVGRFAPPAEKQHFDSADLHLLGAITDVLGAAMDVSLRMNRDRRIVSTLKAILSLAPLGICAVDEKGRVEAVNALAAGWLAVAEGDNIAQALPHTVTLEQFCRGTSFHLRIGGRLLFCESRRPDGGEFVALVMTDLTPDQGRFLDALGREVYRANLLRRPLQFVILDQPHPPGKLLGLVPTLRTQIGRSAVIGPYDATRIGVIFPETTWSGVIPHLRKIADLVPIGSLSVGRAALANFDETPEAMIGAALSASEPFARLTRPRVLVHDGYGAVGDALRLVLGEQCDVTGSTDPAEAKRLIEEQHFDAVLADSVTEASALSLIATAKSHNRQVRGFLLSSMLPERMSGQAHAAAGVPVFSKPFNVELIRDQILASLSSMHVETQK